MSKYKLLLVDLDGTLIDKDRSISDKDRQALDEAARAGIQVSLSSGRSLIACLDVLRQLSLDGYHIFFDGALVSEPSTGREVYVKLLPQKIVREMIDFAHRENIPLDLFSAGHYFAEFETWSTKAHREFFNINCTIVDFNRLWAEERIIKGGLVATNAEEKHMIERFCQHFKDRLHFSWARTPAYPGVDFINVVAPEVSKGKALEALAAHLGISPSQVVAIGDGINDISLLATAGLAIAMGNAPEQVKAVADYVTLDIEHSGLAEAVKKFLV